VRAAVERLCQPDLVRQAVTTQVQASTTDLDHFSSATDRMKLLVSSHDQQAGWLDKVVGYARWASYIPVTLVPHIRLIVAAIYLGAGAFALLDAADRLDAPGTWMPQFVLGVQGIIRRELV